jgi:serine/threonine protein kinase
MSSQRFPRMFGKYALLRPFARGGMGEIYLAAHGELGGAEKLCLVKKVPEDRDAPGLTARLLDEAKVAVRLNHTNLVQVFDAGKVDDELYIAMELIEGRDLRAVWNRTAERRSRIPLDVALYVVREIARGLEYAHTYGGLGLVHRDIAPPNILISFHGEVKVTDFGLARSILKNEKTAPGIVYGRIAYLAPEQARGEQADARTDIFATGVILWELLTGRPLHDTGDDAVKNLDQARHPRIEAPSHLTRGLPPSIDAVSLKGLASEREQRYQTADDFRKAVADELARIAPGTDSSRVSAFLKDLFGDEIKREAAERERLLREELPKLRASRSSQERSQPRNNDRQSDRVQERIAAERLQQQDQPPTRPAIPAMMHEPLEDSLDHSDLLDDDPATTRVRRPAEIAGPPPRAKAPPPLPGMRSTNGGNARPLPGVRPTPPPVGASQAAPPIRSMLARGVHDDDDERTVTAPPRGVVFTPPGPTRGAAPMRAPQQQYHQRDDSGEMPAPEALVGTTVDGRYRIERVLGTGGMGAVYEAEHIEIGKKVALKVLHPQFSRQADLVARFRREARAASKVGHPNIVDVTDSGTTPDGDVYFVMERLDGLDLGEVLRHERRVAPDRVVAIGTQVCRALSAAHAAGIIHRDLKPENIFLVSREGVPDFVKVLDFGIAKQDMGNQNSPRRLTTPGIAMGTPEYMAPEQAAGKAIDGRVDIYSVGAILYEMLTGDPPHHGANVMEILAKKATEAPTLPRELNPDVPEVLEEVVMRCLERDPDRRPQTMGALEYELTKSAKGRGSAVAAVLGLKPNDDMMTTNTWGEESSKPRMFDTGQIQGRRSSIPNIPVPRSGMTGAMPLSADEDKIRVNSSRVASREAAAETLPMDEKRNADLRAVRRQSRWQKRLGLLGGMAFLAIAAFAAYQLQKGKSTVESPQSTVPDETGTKKKPDGEKPVAPIKTVKAPAPKDDDKMSPAEIDRMLEWAKRTAEGGRIIAPPGDNLKELLDRIDKADPGNAQAEALKTRTTQMLGRKGTLALKKSKLDEAEEDFQSLVVLKPDDDWAKGRLARTLTLRSQRSLGNRKLQAALADATAALEMAPEDTGTQLTLADVHLAMGKHELAAEEYQRVLDVKPLDKRAKLGLLKASAPKPKAGGGGGKKKKGR